MHGSLPGLAAERFDVIMFFSAGRLPSFAPEDPPSHASENQITTGLPSPCPAPGPAALHTIITRFAASRTHRSAPVQYLYFSRAY